ncbi:GntR family transcriptional regulator [Radiobacillus sp. PE A8.2]|uniref:GntR family transcriptional regulator n=1 Tax=Radiobacillus sp. PE A8.2 TaxID=3380349 RepID=UPI00388CFCF3
METKYNIVKQAIKSKILDGSFLPHQKISSESEIMKQFGVSRHTVRLAIGDLVNQGWLYRKQGSGTFCADRSKEETPLSNREQYKNIAIITTYISDYIFPSIIRGAESYLSDQGYHVSLFSTNNDHHVEKQILEKILTQQFDGIIIEPTKSAVSNPNLNYYLNLERLEIPYIMINSFYDELEPISITINDEQGGKNQTQHLIDLGHREILGIFKTDDIQGTRRMKGYIKAHRQNGLSINPNNIVTYNTSEKLIKPAEALRKSLSSAENKPTAIVCYNDELAINLLHVLRDMDLQVPNDISIVGFDDSFLANVSEVKLTTIEHPKAEMGVMAGKMILSLVESNEGDESKSKPESVIYESNLVERSSTMRLN